MMHLHEFDPGRGLMLLGAMQSVALANKTELTPIESDFITAARRSFPDAGDLPQPSVVTPQVLAGAFTGSRERRSVLAWCILTALVDGAADSRQQERLDEIESAFDIASPELGAFRDIVDQRIGSLTKTLDRLSFGERMRRAHLRTFPLHAFGQRLKSRLGLSNASLNRKYLALAQLGPETLGRQYFEFVRDNGLSLPGEHNALSEHLVPHDLAHVLGGFGASPAEEILVVTFQAACQKEGAFFSILTAWCLFHLGIRTSGARRVQVSSGELHPESFFAELQRGSAAGIDFSDGWNYWPDLQRPVDEVRRQLGIRPRSGPRPGGTG
jgi:hypothetical protein